VGKLDAEARSGGVEMSYPKKHRGRRKVGSRRRRMRRKRRHKH
jgi:hypothetical protein